MPGRLSTQMKCESSCPVKSKKHGHNCWNSMMCTEIAEFSGKDMYKQWGPPTSWSKTMHWLASFPRWRPGIASPPLPPVSYPAPSPASGTLSIPAPPLASGTPFSPPSFLRATRSALLKQVGKSLLATSQRNLGQRLPACQVPSSTSQTRWWFPTDSSGYTHGQSYHLQIKAWVSGERAKVIKWTLRRSFVPYLNSMILVKIYRYHSNLKRNLWIEEWTMF